MRPHELWEDCDDCSVVSARSSRSVSLWRVQVVAEGGSSGKHEWLQWLIVRCDLIRVCLLLLSIRASLRVGLFSVFLLIVVHSRGAGRRDCLADGVKPTRLK